MIWHVDGNGKMKIVPDYLQDLRVAVTSETKYISF